MARCTSAISFATSLLFVLLLGLPLKAAYAQADPSSCLSAGCHENQSGILHTKHAVKGDGRTPFGSGKACSACHGDNPNHTKDPKANPQPNRFGKQFPSEAQNAVCMTCHKGGQQIHWVGSGHERTQTACSSCHSLHEAKDQVLVPATQAGVCYTCHKDVRAQTFAQSAHPIRQGLMSCSSCHAPHGSLSERFSLVKSSVNDTCYTCHAGKRGPFLWPHPPVVEDCGNCHNPHGSNNPPMLNARGPYLCQQCHVIGQHPAVLRSGAALPPITAGNAAQSAYVVGQNCANCHSKVHGSNHPSGNTFTR
jgi:DmsE family decaheme c-type cytochrome